MAVKQTPKFYLGLYKGGTFDHSNFAHTTTAIYTLDWVFLALYSLLNVHISNSCNMKFMIFFVILVMQIIRIGVVLIIWFGNFKLFRNLFN